MIFHCKFLSVAIGSKQTVVVDKYCEFAARALPDSLSAHYSAFSPLSWHNLLLLVNSEIGFITWWVWSRWGEKPNGSISIQSFPPASALSVLHQWYFTWGAECFFFTCLFNVLMLNSDLNIAFLLKLLSVWQKKLSLFSCLWQCLWFTVLLFCCFCSVVSSRLMLLFIA